MGSKLPSVATEMQDPLAMDVHCETLALIPREA